MEHDLYIIDRELKHLTVAVQQQARVVTARSDAFGRCVVDVKRALQDSRGEVQAVAGELLPALQLASYGCRNGQAFQECFTSAPEQHPLGRWVRNGNRIIIFENNGLRMQATDYRYSPIVSVAGKELSDMYDDLSARVDDRAYEAINHLSQFRLLTEELNKR